MCKIDYRTINKTDRDMYIDDIQLNIFSLDCNYNETETSLFIYICWYLIDIPVDSHEQINDSGSISIFTQR